MEKLNELIQKFCPDGVPVKELNEISEMKRGTSITKKEITIGDVPVISGGREPAYFCNIFNRTGETITVAGSGAGAGFVQYWSIPIFVCDAFSVKGNEGISTKYLYYCLVNMQEHIYSTKKGGGVPHVHIANIDKLKIPVPPLAIQNKIVYILDNYNELIAKFTKELAAELVARKKQYRYYREALLSGSKNAQIVSLKDIVKKSCSGATPSKGSAEFYEGGKIPWLRTQDVRFNEIVEINSFITEMAVKKTAVKWIPANCVIVAISGASAGRCAINKFPTTTNQHCLNMEIDSTKANFKYVFYCVWAKYEELISKKQGARGDLNSSLILGLSIPLPSLEEQVRIVAVLDRLGELCNDVSSDLLAEIEARKKQYEYYRNKLLFFKEL